MPRMAAVLLAMLLTCALCADQWYPPETQKFYSSDGQWRLVVEPRQIGSALDYFKEKVAGSAAAHAGPRATLSRKGSFGMWRRVHRWRLVNEVSPVSALVANDGAVVTFDNWHLMGDGDDVVVIYRPDGTLVRKLALADFVDPDDIDQLHRTASSIWWSGQHRIDERKRAVVLQIKAQSLEEVPLRLDTGALVEPRRTFFEPPRVSTSSLKISAPGPCGEGPPFITIEDVAQYATIATAPAYPVIARKARIAGTVVVELNIDRDGRPHDIRVLKPLPFGLDTAAVDAVRTWQFQPGEACAQVEFRFQLSN